MVAMSEPDHTEDPFIDPSLHESEDPLEIDSTLLLTHNASLTLGAESLIVLGRARSLVDFTITRC